MKLPEGKDELHRAISFVLSDDEELLWAERRGYAMNSDVWVVLVAGLVLLGMSLTFTVLALGPEPPDYCNAYTIIPGFAAALGMLLCAVYAMKGNRRTVYALTEHRALIVQLLPVGKPVVYAVPLSPDLVYRVTLHHDNLMDYNIAEMPLGRYGMREIGFLRVRDNERLQAELGRCGVKLPQPGKQRPATRRLDAYAGLSPLLPMAGWLTLLALMLAGVIRELTDSTTRTYLDLWFNGEQATGTIIGYNQTCTRRTTKINGEIRGVSEKIVYYPVYQLTLADGTTVIRTEKDGSSKPISDTDRQFTVYYSPHHTGRAMRRNPDIFSVALIFLCMGGVCAYMFLQAGRRYLRTRHLPYYLVTAENIK
ncbi:MAG: hypothetical protein IJ943_06895 [Akkermansia sp.]|nr:hypothetical protein [Akkermansia sp.]